MSTYVSIRQYRSVEYTTEYLHGWCGAYCDQCRSQSVYVSISTYVIIDYWGKKKDWWGKQKKTECVSTLWYKKGGNSKKKLITSRNLKDWTKFATENKEKTKNENQVFWSRHFCDSNYQNSPKILLISSLVRLPPLSVFTVSLCEFFFPGWSGYLPFFFQFRELIIRITTRTCSSTLFSTPNSNLTLATSSWRAQPYVSTLTSNSIPPVHLVCMSLSPLKCPCEETDYNLEVLPTSF